jgi:hypothetical protein
VSPVGSYSVLTTINGCTEMSPQVFVDGYVVIGPGDDPCSLDTIDFDKDFNVTIFPNPTQSILHIDTNQMIKIISVYDLTGKEVTVNQVSNTTVDVSNLAKGFYVLKITSETDNIKTTKFVKE